MDSSSISCDKNNNPYLAKRAAKIAQNEERLRSLGLLKMKPSLTTTSSNTTTLLQRRASSNTKSSSSSSSSTTSTPQRRSKRLRGTPPSPSYREMVSSPDSLLNNNNNNKKKRIINTTTNNHTNNGTTRRFKTTPPPPPNEAAPHSARRISLDVHRLLFDQEGVLGRPLARTGKAFCVHESARLASDYFRRRNDDDDDDDDNNTTPNSTTISFNKYSGCQEWANDVLYLWVNLGAPPPPSQGVHKNEFWEEEGRQMMTWYGGRRLHEGSPVIQKLIRVGQQQERQEQRQEQPQPQHSTTGGGAVLLWIRRYDTDTKQLTPYTCWGRLRYVSHESGSQPLRFVWKLVDCNNINNNNNNKNAFDRKNKQQQQQE